MKKLVICLVTMVLGISAFAQETGGGDSGWSALQAGFWFGYPESTLITDVRGVKVGLPVCSGHGTVYGLEMAIFCAATDNVEGMQFTWLGANVTHNLSGLQLALVNGIREKASGVQVGVVNLSQQRGWQFGLVNAANNAPFQLGLVNFNPNGWMPFMIFVNFGKGTFD
ncbi:MAG: hypothetical protein GY750_17480 [Lentisphaerae bacterium]|nr:hypothetical protein [Lentisphaerota bacterium]MCP4103190.1 hypothetical protein [Lentisphaerota bacterium]